MKNKYKYVGIALGAFVFSLAIITKADVTGGLVPTSSGSFSQWSPSTGSTHHTLVDETPCNGTTDYNFTSTVGNRDSYGVDISSLPTGSKITQISITPCAGRNASGGANPVMNVFYRFNGANSADSGSYSLTSLTPATLATTSYTSLSLFKTSSSVLETGAVLTSGTKGARLSRIETNITYTPLNAPTSLSATPSTTTASLIRLTWTDNSTIEDGFLIERGTDGVNYTHIATTTANIVSYNDGGLALGTLYYYRIKTYTSGGSSSSVSASATTSNFPSAPTSLITGLSGSDIQLDWTDNASNEDSFEIQRRIDNGTFSHLATTTADTINFLDTGLTSGTNYVYRVRGFNLVGYSAFTNNSTTTTP